MTIIDKSIFILGLGISGMSLAKKLDFKKVKCWDDNSRIRDLAKRQKLDIKEPNLKNLKITDFLVLSSGINHELTNPHNAIVIAKSLGIPIISDIELIHLLGLKNYLIGITGTNGKSSTTKFITNSLRHKKFLDSQACGNIGIPFTELEINDDSVLVIECSSFQLSKIINLRFDISILLNISSDHIDWHKTFKNYISSKEKIFKNQTSSDHAIICIDDKICNNVAQQFKKKYKSNLIKISIKKKITDGIFLKESKDCITIINSISSDNIKINKKSINLPFTKANLQNLLTTYTVSFILKQKIEIFIESLKNIKALEHRMEYIGKYKNISFFNDSKSTNVNSSISAIESYKNIFWILGGRKKVGGLSGVEKKLSNILKSFTFGESGQEFKKFMEKYDIHSTYNKNLEVTIREAIKDALQEKKQINIIFSPCASSFDQFKNFEERGDFFKKIVKKRVKIEK